jgi:hypothetical protein
MPERYPSMKSIKAYKKSMAYDPTFRTHLLDGKAAAVNLTSFDPKWIGQEVMVACPDSTNDCTIVSSAATFDGTNKTITFNDSNDHCLLLAISMTRWLLVVNNGINLSA